jgi:transposase
MDDKELIQVALGVNSPWYVKVPKKRAWRHLDFFHYEPHLHVRVPRTKCSEHGIKIINLSWARSNSGFSLFFETLIVALCKEMPVSAVADISNIHEDSI